MSNLTSKQHEDITERKVFFDILHVDENSYSSEYLYAFNIIAEAELMFGHPKEWGGIYDTTHALFHNGPLTAGDLLSKGARDILMQHNYCTMIVVKGEDGHYALNMNGYYLFKLFEHLLKERNNVKDS